jgi:orotate phosphoribosyltransferase-like protein
MAEKLSNEIVSRVKELANSGYSPGQIRIELKISRSAIYYILTGKKNTSLKDGMFVYGLNKKQKTNLNNISKNRDICRNTLILSYIKLGMSLEPEQNKIYEG